MVAGAPCCYHHFRIGLRWLEVEQSRVSLLIQQAVRVAQAASKGDDGARDFWLQIHQVAGHYRLPPQE
jgi:hypothetical protein